MQTNESIPILTHDRNLLRFWTQADENKVASSKAGRIMFDQTLMLRIETPGDKSSVEYEVDREYPKEYPNPVHGLIRKNQAIYARYGKYIEDYKAKGNAIAMTGTPIEMWPLVNTRQVAMLKHYGVHSVESLATLADSGIAVIGPGGRELVQKATDWLNSAKLNAESMEREERARTMEARFKMLEGQLADIWQAVSAAPPEVQEQVKQRLPKREPGWPLQGVAPLSPGMQEQVAAPLSPRPRGRPRKVVEAA